MSITNGDSQQQQIQETRRKKRRSGFVGWLGVASGEWGVRSGGRRSQEAGHNK